MKIDKEYDVVVVGAGPAGSIAAKFAAEKGVSVLVLEKDREIGTPVRCGEAVSHEGIAEFIVPDEKFISSHIEKFTLISPDGTEVTIPLEQKGYMLNRQLFDKAVAEDAMHAGAKFITNAYVHGLLFNDSIVSGVKVKYFGEEYEIKSKVVIAADGVESRVGRWAGLSTFVDFREMEGAYQIVAANVSVPTDTLIFYFGEDVAPEGYLWVFPKGEGKANIGIGVSGEIGKTKSAYKYLNEFIDRKYPEASMLSAVSGGVPCTPSLEKIFAPGIILVGDAARQVNPLSGGGIASGMIGGSIGGGVAGEAVIENRPDKLSEYQERWEKRLGKRHRIFDKVKNGVYNFSDEQFNALAKSFSKVPFEKRTLGNLFKKALINQPSLLIEAAKIFVMD